MKKINKILLRYTFFVAVLLLMSTSAYASTCTSKIVAGDVNAWLDWNVADNWNCVQLDGSVVSAVPAVGDDVNINHNVFFTADIAEINDLTIGTGATLEQRNASEQTILGDCDIRYFNSGENTSSHLYEIDFSMENLDLQAAGSIDVSEKGCEGVVDGKIIMKLLVLMMVMGLPTVLLISIFQTEVLEVETEGMVVKEVERHPVIFFLLI